MKNIKLLMVIVCVVSMSACDNAEIVEEKVGTQELDTAIEDYLEANKEKNNEYWDFSDSVAPTAEEVLNGPSEEHSTNK